MRDFLRDYDELRPNLPQLFSLLLNERMMMMMPWYLECFSLPFIVQVFPSRHVVSRTDCVALPICGTRRASKIRNRTSTCVCVRCCAPNHPRMRIPNKNSIPCSMKMHRLRRHNVTLSML